VTETTDASARRQVAYYYPEPYWQLREIDGLKTLLLFFDEIATLLPGYMRGIEVAADPVLAGPLVEKGLLRVLEPETFVDKQMTEELSTILVELITNGTFDDLDRAGRYAELSQSRLGWKADVSLAGMVIEELETRGLARPSRDGVSVPLHPVVRKTVLVLLAQLARRTGLRHSLDLHPTTSEFGPVQDLLQTLAREPLPSAGHVVALDFQTVAVDLASVPLDEVLGFRERHGEAYRAYARDIRRLLVDLGQLSEQDREQLLIDREEALVDQAHDLRRAARKAWRLPFASFSLGAAGAAWAAVGQHDILTALFTLGAGVVGALQVERPAVCAYSYLFEARHVFPIQ